MLRSTFQTIPLTTLLILQKLPLPSKKVYGLSDQKPDKCGNCPAGTHKIRLWVNGNGTDFHFYRQDGNGTWSDKPGQTPAEPVSNPSGYHGYKNCRDLCAANTSTTH